MVIDSYSPCICEFPYKGSARLSGEPGGSGASYHAYELWDHSGLILASFGEVPEIGTKFKYRSLYILDGSVYIVSRGMPYGRLGKRVFCERLENNSHAETL